MKKTLTAFLLMFSAFAWANTLADGIDAYEKGDHSTAARIFAELAGQGNLSAKFNLGLMYSTGEGLPQSHQTAALWYMLAAAGGHAGAQYNIGRQYYDGRGVAQDYKQAAHFYAKAAKQGRALAQNDLGFMYGMGQGVLQDNTRAHMWYNIASANGSLAAPKNRDIIAQSMTPQQVERAQKMARDCMESNYKRCD